MCDYFDVEESKGKASHQDEFPVNWHPHRGFDIASYLKSGTGRHGDSLGNRETYSTPGMQWMSVGSGVEHAEGGANEKGVFALPSRLLRYCSMALEYIYGNDRFTLKNSFCSTCGICFKPTP